MFSGVANNAAFHSLLEEEVVQSVQLMLTTYSTMRTEAASYQLFLRSIIQEVAIVTSMVRSERTCLFILRSHSHARAHR